MDIEELRLFLHLADSLHYGKTSRECNISPSALSRTISRLEEQSGKRLFERSNRSVGLTREGARFRQFAAETVGRWNDLKTSFSADGAALHGELSLYASVTACYSILPEIFERFRARYPGIHIRLRTGDEAQAIEMVGSGAVEIAVAALPDTLPDRLLFRPITITPLEFIAPSPPAPFSGLPDDPAGIPWAEIPLIVPERGLARRRLDRWFRDRSLEPRIYAEVSGNEAILAMVRLGCGAGVVPRLVLEKSPLRETLKVIPVEPPLEPYTVGLCSRKKKLDSPQVRAFWSVADTAAGSADQ